MKFCIIGLGRFGYQLAESLAEHGMEVLAIDKREEIVESIKDLVTQAVCARVYDEETLRAAGVDDVDVAVVAIGENFEESVLITASLKKRLKIPRVVARSSNATHDEILKLVGADEVVVPERFVGKRLAVALSFPFLELAPVTDDFSVTFLPATKEMIGKSIAELDLPRRWRVACFAVKKGEEIVLVDESYVIVANDELVVAGRNKSLVAMAQI